MPHDRSERTDPPDLRVALRESPVGLASLDRSLRFVQVNDALAAMNGLASEAHVGHTPMELFPGLDPETYLPQLRRALAGEPANAVEVVGETPALPGEQRAWEESFYPLRGDDGAIVGVGVAAVDITGRKRAEEALREREGTLRLILESAPSAMLIVARDGEIVDLNGEAERLFGYDRHEVVGRSIDLLVPDRYRARHPALRTQFHRDPRTRAMGHGRDDLAGLRKGGIEFPAEVGLGVAPGRGDLVTCVVTDLTERRRAEVEREELLAAERRLRDRLTRLQRVLDASLAQLSFDDRLHDLLVRVQEAVGGDMASVLLLDDDGAVLVPTASAGLEEEIEAGVVIPIGLGVAGRSAASRQPVHVAEDAYTQVHSEVLRRRHLHSVMAAPLVVDDEVIGVLQVSAERPHAFTDDDVDLLPLVAQRVALAVDRARAFERERSIAEALQHSLLPERLPTLDLVSLSARYLPGTVGMQVGGDWYDVVRLADGCAGLVIGDVMGHGVRAAAVMGQLRSAVRIYLDMGMPLSEIAANVNRVVLELGDAEITSLVVARLDPAMARFEWVSAGHLPPVVRAPDGQVALLEREANPPLGAAHDTSFAYHGVDLAPGSTVLLYTDGLVERRNASLTEGLRRLEAVVAASTADPDELCDAVVGELVGQAASDDTAVLALRTHAAAVAPLELHVEPGPAAERAARAEVGAWLAVAGATDDESGEILVAVSEALTATADEWQGSDRRRHLVARLLGDRVEVVIADRGHREPPDGTDRGRGLVLMEALVDRLVISSDGGGHEVRLARRLADPARS